MTKKKSLDQYRSKLEQRLSKVLIKDGFEYEPFKIDYIVPETKHKYTPDFVKGKTIYEVKGLFTTEDRKKMKLLVEQHPEYTFIMVFQNPNAKLYSKSKTTYKDWCEKNNIEWLPAKGFLNDR